MKKFIFAAAMASLILAVGCGEEVTISEGVKQTDTTQTETQKNEETSSDTDKGGESSSLEDSESADKSLQESQSSQDSQEQSESLADQESQGDSAQSEDISAIAQAQFDKSCQTVWDFLVDCPYELDYDNMSGLGACPILDPSIKSIDDIVKEYCTVFETDNEEIYEKYIASDGMVYCYDGGRGANIYYKNTDLELVSQSDTEVKFTAVSHYADPETGEAEDDKTYDFVIVKVDGVWKTRTFTLLY